MMNDGQLQPIEQTSQSPQGSAALDFRDLSAEKIQMGRDSAGEV